MLVVQSAIGEVIPHFQTPHFSLALNEGESSSAPELGDIDGDGDLDAFVGGLNGKIYYFDNVGTADSPTFASSVENPFSFTDLGAGAGANLALVDIDGDGDLDLFAGLYSGSIAYFANIGSASSPTFAAPVTNPFSLTDVGNAAAPTFVDIDDDGDLDAFVGEIAGSTHFFENVGTPASPAFASVSIDPFGIANVDAVSITDPNAYSSPAFVDVDDDGDLDLYIGEVSGRCVFQENLGSASSPAFGSGSILLFPGVVAEAAPTFADIDDDGDPDAFIGDRTRTVVFFENTGFSFARPDNSFGLANVPFASPAFVDIDDDADLDVFVGRQNGTTVFFENTGSAVAPSYASPMPNPFGLTDLGNFASPALADVDGDGDFDALIGSDSGLFYFENVGSPAAPSFGTAVESPFGIAEFAGETRPSLADIDDDGDLDLFLGYGAGNFYFFLNTGSANAPAFAPFVLNPFDLTDVGIDSAPAFADIDGDGDLDLFSGEGLGALVYYENVGSAALPSFAPKTINPFGLDDIGALSIPAFADIDGDSDLDLLVGGREGLVWFFENVSAFGCPPDVDTCAVGSTKALLSIKVPGKEKLIAKLNLAGPGISQSDFGNPLISEGTAYALCIYGDDDVLAGQMLAAPGGQCGTKPCWKAIGGAPPDGKGMAYKDSAAASDGVAVIKAKALPDGSGRLLVKANNKTGNQPLGIAAALAGDASATVQIRTSDAACFSATISDIRKNDATAFTGR